MKEKISQKCEFKRGPDSDARLGPLLEMLVEEMSKSLKLDVVTEQFPSSQIISVAGT